MTELEFQRLAQQGYTRIPVVMESRADLYTPLAVYLKLAGGPYSYLLESVVGGERFGRYSFIGLPCAERIEARGTTVRRLLRDARGADVCLEEAQGDPLGFVRAYLARHRVAPAPGTLKFPGGLAGYFGYEMVRHVEPTALGAPKPDALGTPDMLLLVSDELAVVDNVMGKLHLVVYADPRQPQALRGALARLETLRARLAAPLPEHVVLAQPGAAAAAAQLRRSVSEEQFLAAVRRSKEYIFAGDCMQVQISQRTSRDFGAPPIALYRALRGLNPSPYMFYFDFGDHHVIGASPEIMVRVAGDRITLRPIAGTRPRGATPEDDARIAAELLADPKERAEHVMLIDLGRNDVGRVAAIGSVRVTEQMVVERYSHVMHIVSNVEGRLRPGLDALDVFRASFPAGTVTGAPKVRAMQIIDELEPVKRGVYSGAVGYLGFNGDMDVAIAIRTAVVKDRQLHVQAAAGVVADSDPMSEWQETQHKARAILKAAEVAAAEAP
ncbi:MAG: anthranilate synthase component I [Betaproteobacteria bacterium]|nr:anthranilate synthase component I [Betaproteobacteria bacterium]MDH5222484.1 anthranilate synthase component I [Betaproteobacteria bacterium]